GDAALHEQRHQRRCATEVRAVRAMVVLDLPRRVVIGGQVAVDRRPRCIDQRLWTEPGELGIPVAFQADMPILGRRHDLRHGGFRSDGAASIRLARRLAELLLRAAGRWRTWMWGSADAP